VLNQSDYLGQDAVSLSAGVRNGDFTVTELTECAISRAETVEPLINSIVTRNFDESLWLAKQFDENPELLQKSNLAGFPFLIKDLSTVKGLPVTLGSKLFKGSVADYSSKIVDKYLDAGLNIFGLTNTPEFGLNLSTEPVANGITKNPWDRNHSTGGSSGAAAAAVAAGVSPAAHATDGGGRIRIPAACCGLFGLKPSRGLTSIEPKQGDSWSRMSVGHVVSQTVKDSAAFLDLITLDKPYVFPKPSSPAVFLEALKPDPGNLKIGIQLTHPLGQSIDQDCIDGINNAAKLCESLGHNVEVISHPVEYAPVVSAMAKLINTHIFQRVNAKLQTLNIELDDAELERSTKIVAKLGSKVSAAEFLAARDTIFTAEQTLAEFHQDYDVILSPVLTKTPCELGWLDMNSEDMKEYTKRFRQYSGFTALYNGTRQPSMSVPLHRTDSGLPVGIMFTGAWGSDLQLLCLAQQLESAQPWPKFAAIA